MNPNSLFTPSFMNKTYAPTAKSTPAAKAPVAGNTSAYNASVATPVIYKAQQAVLDGTMTQEALNNIYQQYNVPYPMRLNVAVEVANANNGTGADTPVGGGGGTVYPDLSGAIDLLRQNISALDPIYQADVANAIKSYDVSQNERKSNYDKSKVASDASGVSNDQTVLNSRNAINKNARMSSEDILSILGALGMNGSTTTKALGTVADKSNENMNSTNYDYGKNKQSILQSWNDFVNADANQGKQIEDTKNYAVAQAGITRDTGKKNYLGQIASNKIAMGNFNTSDILGEMAGINSNIASLTNVPKAYTGVTPTYTAPAISTILGQNLAKFDVAAGDKGVKKAAPKLIKVNEQTPTGDKYGLV